MHHTSSSSDELPDMCFRASGKKLVPCITKDGAVVWKMFRDKLLDPLKPEEIKRCEYCGAQFFRRDGKRQITWQNFHRKRFCSRSCAGFSREGRDPAYHHELLISSPSRDGSERCSACGSGKCLFNHQSHMWKSGVATQVLCKTCHEFVHAVSSRPRHRHIEKAKTPWREDCEWPGMLEVFEPNAHQHMPTIGCFQCGAARPHGICDDCRSYRQHLNSMGHDGFRLIIEVGHERLPR